MNTINTKLSLNNLIESRLSMQSTQRELRDSYGVLVPTVKYLTSYTFGQKLKGFNEYQKRSLFTLLAGPFNWKSAAKLIDKENSESVI